MSVQSLGESIGAAGAQAAVAMGTSPLVENGPADAEIVVSPDFNGTAAIEVSTDGGTTYTAVLTVTGTNQPNKKATVNVGDHARLNVSAWTAGLVSGYLNG